MAIKINYRQEKISQRLRAIDEEIRRTPYHKGTEHHLGLLKARRARLQQELVNKTGKQRGGDSFFVRKNGLASCLFLGPPSVGKSSLLNALSQQYSPSASYPFTTKRVIPGIMSYRQAKIQLLDAPGLLPQGKLEFAWGRRILAAARASDLILLLIDRQHSPQIPALLRKIYQAGIRLNKKPLSLQILPGRGEKVEIYGETGQYSLTYLQKLALTLGIRGKRIFLHQAPAKIDDFLDALATNITYRPAILVATKIDELEKKEIIIWQKQLEKFKLPLIFISAKKRLGLMNLKKIIWQNLNLINLEIYLSTTAKKVHLAVHRGETLAAILKKIILPASPPRPRLKIGRQRYRQLSLNYCPNDHDLIYL